MTTPPYGELPSAGRAGRRRVPLRVVVLGVLIVVVLLATVGGGSRQWWARRVADVTGGNRGADFVLGFLVAMLPLLGVALGAIGRRGPRRVLRMLLFGAVDFLVLYLLAPAPATYLTDGGTKHYVDRVAPGYLAGAFTASLVWIALLVLAVWWGRRWWRRFRDRAFDPGRAQREPPRIVDI